MTTQVFASNQAATSAGTTPFSTMSLYGTYTDKQRAEQVARDLRKQGWQATTVEVPEPEE